MRAWLLASVIALGLVGTAQAAITYNVKLVDSINPLNNGSGLFTLDTAPQASGLSYYTADRVSNLVLNIGGQVFTTDNGTLTSVVFTDQQFSALNYLSLSVNFPTFRSLSASNVYTYNDFAAAQSLSGTFEVTPTSSAVPEPASLALLGLGVAGIVAARRRRVG